MLQFLCVELSKQICDSSTGQGGRANLERHIAAGHLHLPSVSDEQRKRNNDKRFVLFISFNTL